MSGDRANVSQAALSGNYAVQAEAVKNRNSKPSTNHAPKGPDNSVLGPKDHSHSSKQPIIWVLGPLGVMSFHKPGSLPRGSHAKYTTWTPKVCEIMALMTVIMGLGLFFYILLGFR